MAPSVLENRRTQAVTMAVPEYDGGGLDRETRSHLLRKLVRRLRHPTRGKAGYAHARIDRLRRDVDVWGRQLQESVGYVGDLASDHDDRLERVEHELAEVSVSPDELKLARLRQEMAALKVREAQREAELDAFLATLAGASETVFEAADRLRRRRTL